MKFTVKMPPRPLDLKSGFFSDFPDFLQKIADPRFENMNHVEPEFPGSFTRA